MGVDGRFIRCRVRHLSVNRAARFMAKVSVFGVVNVGKVLLLIGSEGFELVHCVRG